MSGRSRGGRERPGNESEQGKGAEGWDGGIYWIGLGRDGRKMRPDTSKGMFWGSLLSLFLISHVKSLI